MVFCCNKRKPWLIFRQYNWFNSKTITLCSFHCSVLLVCLCVCVAGIAMNKRISCWPVNDFVHFHRYVWQPILCLVYTTPIFYTYSLFILYLYSISSLHLYSVFVLYLHSISILFFSIYSTSILYIHYIFYNYSTFIFHIHSISNIYSISIFYSKLYLDFYLLTQTMLINSGRLYSSTKSIIKFVWRVIHSTEPQKQTWYCLNQNL